MVNNLQIRFLQRTATTNSDIKLTLDFDKATYLESKPILTIPTYDQGLLADNNVLLSS
jgi:hypothetical protein